MQTLRFAPLERELSRLVLGTAWWTIREVRLACDLAETFLELGGNAFDRPARTARGSRRRISAGDR